ncbi:lysozyme inhibitor LprI family protein [Dyella sp.]|uniref:lysozyme inhibitor LprI family protein n=1 Tax=Dyella sp. TaxID=1869338 RepID=UPI002ED43491
MRTMTRCTTTLFFWSCIFWSGITGCVATDTRFVDNWPSIPLPSNRDNTAAYAQAVGLRRSYVACLMAADDVPKARIDCASQEARYQRMRKQQALTRLLSSHVGIEGKQIRAEERRWITFRDDFCASDDDAETDVCLVEQTADRATQLEGRIELAHVDTPAHEFSAN